MTGVVRPVFRFAPSPNGRLHLGHAASAMLNADLARRSGGRLILRLEDIDPGRSRPELADAIRDDLAWLGLRFDGPVRSQSRHLAEYRAAVETLAAQGLAYPCFCSRGVIATATKDDASRDPDGAALYPGTCRRLTSSEVAQRVVEGDPHTWRLDMARALASAPGPYWVQSFDPALAQSGGEGDALSHPCSRELADPTRWGDVVIARRDVPTSYHLAVVMDDGAQGITHVVRGADLRAATDLHVLLQALLGVPSPRYHHHALVRDASGEKLAKSRGSRSLGDLRASGVTPEDIRRILGFDPRGEGAF